MSEIENKFIEFVREQYRIVAKLKITRQLLKDLAEIAYKYYMADNSPAKFENTELKEQLKNEREWKLIYSEENTTLKKQIEKFKEAIKESKNIVWRKPLEDWIKGYKESGCCKNPEVLDDFLFFMEESYEPIEDEEISKILEGEEDDK